VYQEVVVHALETGDELVEDEEYSLGFDSQVLQTGAQTVVYHCATVARPVTISNKWKTGTPSQAFADRYRVPKLAPCLPTRNPDFDLLTRSCIRSGPHISKNALAD
jgi:hypothetical protein